MKKLLMFVVLVACVLTLAGCSLGGIGKKANCYASNVQLGYNGSYHVVAKITNDGDKDATGVAVYYYYLDAFGQKFIDATYVGTIKAGSTINFVSNILIDYGYGIVSCGITEIKWS